MCGSSVSASPCAGGGGSWPRATIDQARPAYSPVTSEVPSPHSSTSHPLQAPFPAASLADVSTASLDQKPLNGGIPASAHNPIPNSTASRR